MNVRSALLVVGLLAPLGAAAPARFEPLQTATTTTGSTWNLAVGSQLVFNAVSGPNRLQITQLPDGNLRVTVMSDTVLTVTPDPTAVASYRQWTLVAGTDITINLAGGAIDWDTSRRAGTATITLTQGSASGFATTTTTMTIDPDPGTGRP